MKDTLQAREAPSELVLCLALQRCGATAVTWQGSSGVQAGGLGRTQKPRLLVPIRLSCNLWIQSINGLADLKIVLSFFKLEHQTFPGSSFLNVSIRRFSSSLVTVNEETWGFGPLVGQKLAI